MESTNRRPGISVDEAAVLTHTSRHLILKAIEYGDLTLVSTKPVRLDPREVERYGEEIRRQRRAITELIKAGEEEDRIREENHRPTDPVDFDEATRILGLDRAYLEHFIRLG
ncbi:hypothetical protein [Bifidobacterium felsineum]|uniref:hypothetical protein n=1 Tax=Bifidobacterium felsineum TaxID=2045440 RepID=UPI001BDDBBCA|nr:hypothetical protein [Bifidobacterium felsineum]MBT1164836.1 hypothetical protein [Bifidobacterium felsineum]